MTKKSEPMSYDEEMQRQVPDWEVAEWEEKEDELKLHVCSLCGLIASELVDHGDCSIQDWWELNVRCFVKPEFEEPCPQCKRKEYTPSCQYCNENRYLPKDE